MSWLSFLSPSWALMGLIAIPIILLYILRQRRPDLPVSSTLLWSKTLADMRASTPFQKLRRHLLLFLQLLILAALVFTLMRPVVQAQASQSSAGVIVLDATASMQTHDGYSTESRLDRAKIEAKKLVDRMRPGDRFMLIADGGGMGQVRSGFTSSKSELKSLIDSVKPSDTPNDLSESLLLAATSLRAIGGAEGGGGSRQSRPKDAALTAGQVWLFSDGAGIRLPDTLGDKNNLLQFIQIGSSDHSVGITRLSITPVPKTPGAYEVFVGLKNAWSVDKKVGVTLALGTKDNFLPDQAKFVTLPPTGTGGVTFENVAAPPGKLFARVDDADDDFPLDNTAYGIIEPPRKVRVVLVTKGNDFFERMLQTAVNVGLAEGQIIAPEFYNPAAPADLFILDGFLPPPDKFPRVDTLIVRPSVTNNGDASVNVAGFLVSHQIQNPTILRWKREDPLLQNVELGDLRVYNSLLMDKDPAAVEIISAPEGPLAAYKDFSAQRRYFIPFSPLLESNWYRLSSLIVFMQNLIEQTRERHFIGMPQLVASGNPAKLYGSGDRTLVTLPNGDTLEVPAKDGVAEFAQTDQLGFYDVKWPDGIPENTTKTSLFAVNLLSPAESDIRPQSLQTLTHTVNTSSSVARVNREIWRWLAAAALVFLLLEWWAYHRRVA